MFGYDEDKKKLYTIRTCGQELYPSEIANLYLHDDFHYCAIPNLSGLVSAQLSKKDHRKDICLHCLNALGRLTKKEKEEGKESLLEKHKELCDQHKIQRSVFPTDKDMWLHFKDYEKIHYVPFVVYTNFESFIVPIEHAEPSPKKLFTVQYQKHVPCGFCHTIKCFDESIYKTKTVLYTAQSPDKDIGKKFVESLEAEIEAIHKILKIDVRMQLTDEEGRHHKKTSKCYACDGNHKTKDHCHITGKYCGAVCNNCNLRMQVPGFVPVLFHNLGGYDSYLFTKNLGYNTYENISCIPKTDKKYISFSKGIPVRDVYINEKGKKVRGIISLRFLDSLKFMASSLDKLSGNLKDNQFKIL